MVLNMKFKIRVVFSIAVAAVLVFSLFVRLMDSNLTGSMHVQKSSRYFLGGLFASPTSESFTCARTPVVNSTADIDTIHIWDNIDTIPVGANYKVKFPPEESPQEDHLDVEPLTVLIVPHSHNDPGWVKTLDDYFHDSTRQIFDTMLQKLRTYPDMRMVWAETVFLSMWYEQASAENRVMLKKLVDNGQLDIVTGGWVMPDEASTHYYSIIDQLIEGHQWLLKTLGIKPRINWSIDPFGHSGTVPYLWRLANFDAIIVQRIHQAIKDYLGHYKKQEFNWRQIWDSKGQHDMLCHMMPYLSYDSTATCGPDDLVCRRYVFKNRGMPRLGVPGTKEYSQRLEEFVFPLYEQFRLKAKNYQHNVIFVPLGGDFEYDNSVAWDRQYSSYTKIMEVMNSKKEWNIKVRFGSLTEYFNLVKQLSPPIRYPSITGDFYVYSDYANQYWSGYFTSRPLDKFLGREIQSLLKAADVLHILATVSFSTIKNNYEAQKNHKRLEKSRRNLALYQHHDAITGTAKPFVVLDYEIRLSAAFSDLQIVMKEAVMNLLSDGTRQADQKLINTKPTADAFDLFHRRFVYTVKSSGTNVVLFNPSPFQRIEMVSLTIDQKDIEVADSSQPDRKIVHQISPVWGSKTEYLPSTFDVSFLVDISPWSLVTYTLTHAPSQSTAMASLFVKAQGGQLRPEQQQQQQQQQAPFKTDLLGKADSMVLENACLRVSISSLTGAITEIFHKNTNTTTPIVMQMASYKPGSSGAYLFAPLYDEAETLKPNSITVTRIRGVVYSAVKVVHPLYQTMIRLSNSTEEELSCWAVAIDSMATLHNSIGDELVMRFNTDINNGDILYTDGNGLHMVKHRRFQKLPLPAAYYPMTSMATIQDARKRFTLHSAQPLGVASLRSGSMEVMLDRTFATDDNKGLGEGIRENQPAPSKFLVFLEPGVGGPSETTNYFHPTLQSSRLGDMLQNPLYSLSYDPSLEMKPEFNPGIFKIPCDANVISFRPLSSDNSLNNLRTAFILEKRGHGCGSTPGSLPCTTSWERLAFSLLLGTAKPSSVTEMSLSLTDFKANLTLSELIHLNAMDIKSFSIDWDIS